MIFILFAILPVFPELTGSSSPIISNRNLFQSPEAAFKNVKISKRSTCVPDPNDQLTVSPKTVGMLGGEMLDISGPCFDSENPVIKCRFRKDDNFVTIGFKKDDSTARCSVPTMTFRGRVTLDVSIDFKPYKYATTVLIAMYSQVDKLIELPYLGKDSGWNETNTKRLTINWDKSALSNRADAKVNIQLIGYRETGIGVGEVEWANLVDLGSTLASSGTYTFDTNYKMCTVNFCNDYEVGVVKVELVDEKLANTHSFLITSTMLGFFVNTAMKEQLGNDWTDKKCLEWYEKDKGSVGWRDTLPSCPCSLPQALADIGRWYADAKCDMYAGSECIHHKGAIHCVRSLESLSDGAGNQCCYDAEGDLMYAADSFEGSTADRSNYYGTPLYGKPGFVPTLSHRVKDVVPFHYCCLWSGYKHCSLYTELRPTIDCAKYSPPTVGMVFGQAHIRTFDGLTQRMCQAGDYKLLVSTDTKFDDVIIQARFSNYNGQAMPLALTHLAIRVGIDGTVEVKLVPLIAGNTHPYFNVIVDGQQYSFNKKSSSWQDYAKFTVINTDKERPEKPGNFTIILKNGMGIRVGAMDTLMIAELMIPEEFTGSINGLMGNFNGDPNDDSNGYSEETDQMMFYQRFQYEWAVNNSESSIMPDVSAPVYESKGCSKTMAISDVAFCEENKECAYDFILTNNDKIAKNTLYMTERLEELQQFTTPVRSCGLLHVEGVIKSSNDYTLGSVVTVTGCEDGKTVQGAVTYTCVAKDNYRQSWSPEITAVCVEPEVNSDVVIGVVIAVIAVVLLAILIVVFIWKFRRTKKEHDQYILANVKPDAEDQESHTKNQEPETNAKELETSDKEPIA